MCSLTGAAPELSLHIHSLVPDSCSKNCDPFKRLVLLHPVLLTDKKTSCPNLPSAFTEEAKIMTRGARNIPINHQPNFGSCLFSCCQIREAFSKGLVYMRCANADLPCTLFCSPLSYIASARTSWTVVGGCACSSLTMVDFPAALLAAQSNLLWSSAARITIKQSLKTEAFYYAANLYQGCSSATEK